MGKNKWIPDGWLKYSNVGKPIPGTRLIAFKVPLGKSKDWNLSILKEAVPGLKSIIDLSFAKIGKYYQPSECAKLNLWYKKIFIPGGEVVPAEKEVLEFFSVVSELSASDVDGLIGVHCTHGLNRTGYMICRYLIEKKGLDPDVAIDVFDLSRGHKQERENYLMHLRSKSWQNGLKDQKRNHKQESLKRKKMFDSFADYQSKFKKEDNETSGGHYDVKTVQTKGNSFDTSWSLKFKQIHNGKNIQSDNVNSFNNNNMIGSN